MADSVLDTIEKRIRELETEKGLWVQLRELHRRSNGDVQQTTLELAAENSRRLHETEKPKVERRLPPTESVMDMVRRYPGILQSDLLDALEGNVKTTSRNERALLAWTAREQARKGRLRKDGQRLYLP